MKTINNIIDQVVNAKALFYWGTVGRYDSDKNPQYKAEAAEGLAKTLEKWSTMKPTPKDQTGLADLDIITKGAITTVTAVFRTIVHGRPGYRAERVNIQID